MTKIDIYSGFLGAGKTTLIKKMIKEAYHGQKLVLIENEFGEIGIDGGFLQEAGIQITEMNSGCICCSLVGDFGRALKKVIAEYAPDRILIEPSGVGKLSDVIGAVRKVTSDDVQLGNFVTVADATKCKMYMKNFGEFYNNQIETANTIILSRTDGMKEEKLDQCVAMIREHNKDAVIVTTPWPELTGEQLMEAMEQRSTIAVELAKLEEEAHHHHHDHDDDDDEDATTGVQLHHHHHDDDDEDEHEHHHHTTTMTTRTSATIRTAAAIITMTMTTRTNTSITTIITITTAMTPTRSSSAGARRRTGSSPRLRSSTSCRRWRMRRPTASSCGPRAMWPTPRVRSGSTSTTCPASLTSVTAAQWSPAASASSARS